MDSRPRFFFQLLLLTSPARLVRSPAPPAHAALEDFLPKNKKPTRLASGLKILFADFAYRIAPRHPDGCHVNRYQQCQLAGCAFMERTVYSAFLAFSTISFFRALPSCRATGRSPSIFPARGQPLAFSISNFRFFLALEEQQRDFVACKTRPLGRAAGSHGDVAVRLASDFFLQFRRELAEVPRLEANHRSRPRTRQSSVAGPSRVRRGASDAQAFG